MPSLASLEEAVARKPVKFAPLFGVANQARAKLVLVDPLMLIDHRF